MARKTYWEQLRDPKWQRRRLEIMERADFKCECCGSAEKTLNVHHRLYRKGAKPWEYADHELRCLCEDCHGMEHEWRSKLDETLARLDIGELEYILGFAEGRLALSLEMSDLDKREITVKSCEHAEGLLAALWMWNSGGAWPSPDCLIDHRALDDRLVCSLGEGEMPHPLTEAELKGPR